MPTIHNEIQGTIEWMRLRWGRPTASEFKNLMTAKFEQRDGEMPKTYLAEKVAEKILNHALPGFGGSFDTEQGQMVEDEARAWFELEVARIRQVGFVTSDDDRCGCSPDGLIGEDGGLELKCPLAQTHVKYLLAGGLPPEYAPQVHGSLYVTGRKEWTFMSYRRPFPPHIVRVQRDPVIMYKIETALKAFYEKFDAACNIADPTGEIRKRNAQTQT
jgi:hypothetical protein